MQQNEYLITGHFADLPDDVNARLVESVFELNEENINRRLTKFSGDLSQFYAKIFDSRYIDSEENNTSSYIREFRLETDEECEYLYESMRMEVLRRIEKTRNYAGGFTTLPVFDKTSQNFVNIKTQALAAIKNLQRMKHVIDAIFQERREEHRIKYEISMRRDNPETNPSVLYLSSEFLAWDVLIAGLKQNFFANIDDLIEELHDLRN
jgi:hypothetical protein